MGQRLVKHSSFLEFFLFAGIPLVDGADITYHPGVHFAGRLFAFGFTDGTAVFLPAQIPVAGTDAEGRRNCKIWQLELIADLADQLFD